MEFHEGQEVWVIERDIDGYANDITCIVFLAQVDGCCICSPFLGETSDIEYMMNCFCESTARNESIDILVYPMSDCYMDCEEASKAMRKEVENFD